MKPLHRVLRCPHSVVWMFRIMSRVRNLIQMFSSYIGTTVFVGLFQLLQFRKGVLCCASENKLIDVRVIYGASYARTKGSGQVIPNHWWRSLVDGRKTCDGRSRVSGAHVPELHHVTWSKVSFPKSDFKLRTGCSVNVPLKLLLLQSSIQLLMLVTIQMICHYWLWQPLRSSSQRSWLESQRSRLRFPSLPDFLRISGSGTVSTQPREDKSGAIWKKK
jgi:hypothetical protein